MPTPLHGASARVDVTPSADLLAAGAICTGGFWYERALPLRTVREPIHARVALLRQAGREIAIVSWDALGDGVGLHARVRAQLDSHGAAAVALLLAATHAHTVPDTIQLSGRDLPEAYLAHVTARITGAILDARRRTAPVSSLAIGTTSIGDLVVNRRPILRDGRLAVLETTPAPADIGDPGMVDDRLTVVTFAGADGRPLARLVHAACHPVSMQAQAAIAPGFPGGLAQRFEEADGSAAATLYLNGACGDINPRQMGRWEHADALADACYRRAANAPVHVATPGELAVATATLRAPRREIGAAPRVAPRGDAPAEPASAEHRHSGAGWQAFLRDQAERVTAWPPLLDLPLGAWRVGPLLLATAGGELFAESGLALRAVAPSHVLLPVSYANAYCGYLAPRHAYARGGYETACAPWCPLAPGETERALDTLSALVRTLT